MTQTATQPTRTFISFEGTEGVGKSTLVASLKAWLEAQNQQVVVTREPGGTELGEALRALLLNQDMSMDAELLLMFAARAEHIHKVILPALNSGKWVLCDRFVDASFAYQGAGRGIDLTKIQRLQADFVPRLPDVTFWLDAPVSVGLERAATRTESDRFEQQKQPFFEKIRTGYAAQAEAYPERFVRVDATQKPEMVFEAVAGVCRERLFVM